MKAYIFPGQGSQYVGMGKDLYEMNPKAKVLFEEANDILGYRITDLMFNGTEEELKQTRVTQPAVFIHSVISALCVDKNFEPSMVAGHSLGEFSALVAAKALSFEDGLKLVLTRALAMQKACDALPSTMAAVISLSDEVIKQICDEISWENNVVVPANYNCPGQVVISGNIEAVNEACRKMKEAGAKRVLPLAVSGAFHSPCMELAKVELQKAIESTVFSTPNCPIYQNVDANPHIDIDEIRNNLIAQLTSSVQWTQTIQNMCRDGAEEFVECGPGKVLQGLIKKIDTSAVAYSNI